MASCQATSEPLAETCWLMSSWLGLTTLTVSDGLLIGAEVLVLGSVALTDKANVDTKTPRIAFILTR